MFTVFMHKALFENQNKKRWRKKIQASTKYKYRANKNINGKYFWRDT